MKRLSRAIMADWEIADNRPKTLRAVQFGDSSLLLGLIDRLIDEANERGADIGLAAVQLEKDGHAARLNAQDGMYNCVIRGDLDEREKRYSRVIQCVLEACDPSKENRLNELAALPSVSFVLLERDALGIRSERDTLAAALTAHFLVKRRLSGLDAPEVIVISEDADAAEKTLAEVLALVPELKGWLGPFRASFADSLVRRCTPAEAARFCEKENYQDEMICLGEPYGEWVIRAEQEVLPGVAYAPEIEPLCAGKRALFDAGLCLFAALGTLHADGTLADCLKDEPLRDMAGKAFTEEILPYTDIDRKEAAAYLIRCYERYGNPLIEHMIPDCAEGLLTRFKRSVIPAIKRYAEAEYTAPKGLTAALAAVILLYADAREKDGVYATIVGGDAVPLIDDKELLRAFSSLASDMPAESLAYAVLADREIWGEDLREIDGLEEALTNDLLARLIEKAAMEEGK